MKQSWRWFGPQDPVKLREVRQAGVTDVVSSLHHIACGELWPREEISKRMREVAWDAERNRASGLAWTIVESLPIHEDIKTRSGRWREYLDIYKENLARLGEQGIKVICYNFIPVLDWARTDLNIEQEDGSTVSGCNADAFIAFDLFILQRPGAERDYPAGRIAQARQFFDGLSATARQELRDNIFLGLPGTVEGLDVEEFTKRLNRYAGISDAQLRRNLYDFLNELMPVCERHDLYMSIHPDDPAYPLFGVPRVLSTSADVEQLFREVPSQHSGLTLCSGSFGSCIDNNPAAMFERFAERIYFVHFRNVTHVPGQPGSFYESNHLTGSVEMARAMRALISEEERRRAAKQNNWAIPVRPDHGKLMDGDRNSGSYPGYSRTGRMIGLAELRGLEHGLRFAMGLA